jgi:putative transposase
MLAFLRFGLPTTSSRRDVIHDRDNVYGDDFGSKLGGAGIADIRTPYRAPLANSVAERVVRTLRQECLDHVIVLNERHPLALLTEFVCYYNHDRPHRTIELETPVPSPPISHGDVVSRPILGAFTTSMRGRHERCTYAALQGGSHAKT